MRRITAVLIVMVFSLSLLSAFDPYAAALGRPQPVPVHHYRRFSPSELEVSLLSDALGIRYNNAESILRLLHHAEEIDRRQGSVRDAAYGVISSLKDIYDIRRPHGDEDDALRSLSHSLDRILDGRGSWADLERAVKRNLPTILRALMRHE